MKEWARSQGVHPVTAYRWFREGKLPVPARRVGRLILVGQADSLAPPPDDELVQAVAAVLLGLCARVYGADEASDRARRAVEAVTEPAE